jgi:hypothetical protein
MALEPAPSPTRPLWSIMLLVTKSLHRTNHTGATSIVFVHGLTGNRETTWTHKQSKTFWPQTLLAHDLPNARILTFGYDADIVGVLNTAGSNTLRDHGKSLTNDVALRRIRSRTVSHILCKAHGCSVSSRGPGTTSSYLCRAQPWRARGRTGQI